jgi:glutaredoxin
MKIYGVPSRPDRKRSKKFLAEHRIPYDWIDIDDDADGLRFVEALQKGGRTIPTILFPGGSFLLEPSDAELARKLGLKIEADRQAYDLAIVGGGPAGLAAAIYAAREGIDAVVIDRSAMGGQAGVTERILRIRTSTPECEITWSRLPKRPRNESIGPVGNTSLRVSPSQIPSRSSVPEGQAAAFSAPAELPIRKSGRMPRRARTCSMPTWTTPSLAPPVRTKPIIVPSRCWTGSGRSCAPGRRTGHRPSMPQSIGRQ